MTTSNFARRSINPLRVLVETGRHSTLVFVSFICLFPLYWMLVSSFKNPLDIYGTDFLPPNFTLENYTTAFANMPILKMLGNSFIVALCQVTAQIFVAVLTAYALMRWEFKGKTLLYMLLSLTWVVPIQAIMVPNYVLIGNLGVRGTLWAIFLPFMVSVFACISLYQSFSGFPKALIEAATIDGAGEFVLMTQVLLPNMRSNIASLSILQFITSWNEYTWSSLVTNSVSNAPIQIGLKSFIGSDNNMWGSLMAAAIISCLPILILYLIMQRNIINSFMKWGIK